MNFETQVFENVGSILAETNSSKMEVDVFSPNLDAETIKICCNYPNSLSGIYDFKISFKMQILGKRKTVFMLFIFM